MFQKIKKISAQTWLWLLLALVHIGLLGLLFSQFMITTFVRGNSMNPTLTDGMCLIAVAPVRLQTGDVVVANSQALQINIIKRVIALPGDTVAIADHTLYRNGIPQKEAFLPQDVYMEDMAPVTLQEGQYFLMGDNRNNSMDSRRIGPVSRDEIRWKVPLNAQLWLWVLRIAVAVAAAWWMCSLVDLETEWIMILLNKRGNRRKEAALV